MLKFKKKNNICTEYFKHGIYSPFFFPSSKWSLFHNSNVFGSCIIHILYTGCAKIKKNNSGAKLLRMSGCVTFRHPYVFMVCTGTMSSRLKYCRRIFWYDVVCVCICWWWYANWDYSVLTHCSALSNVHAVWRHVTGEHNRTTWLQQQAVSSELASCWKVCSFALWKLQGFRSVSTSISPKVRK